MKYNISIHDVSPNNLDNIKEIVCHLRNYGCKKISLLVIPGLKWNEEQIKRLKSMQDYNVEIAAHGWRHNTDSIKNLSHYIHSKLISRNAAEHLSKDRTLVIDLIQNSFDWFIKNKFNTPTLYVAPAWALGAIKYSDLDRLPFSEYETITGVYSQNRLKHIALIGFEADTLFRKYILKISNFLNYQLSRLTGILRIAIHPNDFNLLLSSDINQFLSKVDKTIYLHELKNRINI